MNDDEKKVVAIMSAYVAVMVAPFAVSYLNTVRKERKKRKEIDRKADQRTKQIWFAAGKVVERLERGDYNGLTKDDLMLDLELEVIKAEEEDL